MALERTAPRIAERTAKQATYHSASESRIRLRTRHYPILADGLEVVVRRLCEIEMCRSARELQQHCALLIVMQTVTIPVEKIVDWPSFHETFQGALGFPAFYGRNMDAWIDCMTSVDAPSDRLTAIAVQPGEILLLRVDQPFEFRRRCPEQYDALIECTAFVNYRRVETGDLPVLALLLVGSV